MNPIQGFSSVLLMIVRALPSTGISFPFGESL